MRRLQIVFWSLPSLPSRSCSLLIQPFFPFVSITRSKFEFSFLFFVVDGGVTFFISSVFALVWLVVLVVFVNGFDFWVSSWSIWMNVAGGLREDS